MAYLNFHIIFFCCSCGCLMHVSVYENCRIQSTSIWYKNHQGILNVTKVMTVYIQEPWLKILLKIPVRAQRFVGSPPYSGCIMIYSNYQMCPALNSKPYRSNKQFVPLFKGCSSDAPGSPGNHLDRTFFQPNFVFEIKLEI